METNNAHIKPALFITSPRAKERRGKKGVTVKNLRKE